MANSNWWTLVFGVWIAVVASAHAEERQAGSEKVVPQKTDNAKATNVKAAEPLRPDGAKETVTPAGAATPASSGAYTVRLRDLEERVNRLKEQIFRSKARLSLLAETVLDRKIAGAKAKIIFRNKMGGSFRLVQATFLLDGAPIYDQSDESDGFAEKEILNLFDGPVMPGDHTISVILNYRGHGYGIFSYLKGYSFKTRSSRTFTVDEGKALRLDVIGYEKGGATTALEERPDVRYEMNMADFQEDSAASEGDKKAKEKGE